MKRKEAEKLIGTRVEAWTSMNGSYIGTLEEVFGSPWRGRVRITGVVKPAVVYDLTRRGSPQRRGFRPGQVIEVGGMSIKPTEEEGASYLEALRRELEIFEKWNARDNVNPKDRGWLPFAIKNLKAAIGAEERREAGRGEAGAAEEETRGPAPAEAA